MKEIFMLNTSVRMVLLTIITLFTGFAFAKAPEKLEFTCSSQSIGKIAITLSQPHSFGSAEIVNYKITSQRFERQTGELLGSDEYPIDTHSNDAIATLSTNDGAVSLYSEPTLHITVPAFGVDWLQHQTNCYARAPSFGINLTLGINSNTVYEDHSKAYIRTYQRNPQVNVIMVPSIPFSEPHDFLAGKRCPDTNQWQEADEITCSVTTNE
jgi:hypothetical protein